MSPERRRHLYAVIAAVAGLVVAYGVLDQGQVSLWLALAAALLGGGGNLFARAHVDTTTPAPVVSGTDSWGRD